MDPRIERPPNAFSSGLTGGVREKNTVSLCRRGRPRRCSPSQRSLSIYSLTCSHAVGQFSFRRKTATDSRSIRGRVLYSGGFAFFH